MRTTLVGTMLALVLSGCSTMQPAREVDAATVADNATHRVSCVPGRPDLCHAAAVQRCPSGYDEVPPPGGAVVTRPPPAGATAAAAAPEATPTTLLVSCK